jgi:putative transposase
MSETDRLSEDTSWIDLEFIERERTPEPIIEVDIQLHLAGLSLLNTKQALDRLGVSRSRTAIHNWVRKAELQPTSDVGPNQVAVDETVIQINDERHWLYAAIDPETNEFLHTRLFSTRTTQLTVPFLRELREKQHLDDATVFVDAAPHLTAALDRLGLRFPHPSPRKSERRRTYLS